jgi:hypothetical protein
LLDCWGNDGAIFLAARPHTISFHTTPKVPAKIGSSPRLAANRSIKGSSRPLAHLIRGEHAVDAV